MFMGLAVISMTDVIRLRSVAVCFSLALLFLAGSVFADDYKVTTLRATPGGLETLIEKVKSYRQEKNGDVIIMRHSQGDHWDLMLLEPTAGEAVNMRDFGTLADFQHSFLAHSEESFQQVKRTADSTGLYHIEMFQALAGKKQALLEQRINENKYLQSTGQVTNSVFVTTFGSDVDVFTVGFHSDLAAFAKGPAVTADEAETAAKNAGFKNRADLGFYLRTLIIAHHDTLAVAVGD